MEEIHRRGKTIILVSHDLDSIERLCTRACLLRRGRIEAEGAPAAITSRYRSSVDQ
jgi:ABC-type polysaccharide/polyol phosphate transport system ATPase subunit